MKYQNKYHGKHGKEEFVLDIYKCVQRRKMRHSSSFLENNTKSLSRLECTIALLLLLLSQSSALRCYMDSSDPNHPGVEDCLQVDGHVDGGRLCASTLIVYYEDKEIKLGIQRSCAAEDPDQKMTDGSCHTKTVSNSAGHEGMETMTCYCKTDLCNNRSFRRNNFKKWQKNTEALFKARIESIAWKLFDWVPEIFFYSVVIGAMVVIVKFLSSMPQFSSKKRRRKENKLKTSEESDSDENDGISPVISENDIRSRSKRIKEEENDS